MGEFEEYSNRKSLLESYKKRIKQLESDLFKDDNFLDAKLIKGRITSEEQNLAVKEKKLKEQNFSSKFCSFSFFSFTARFCSSDVILPFMSLASRKLSSLKRSDSNCF